MITFSYTESNTLEQALGENQMNQPDLTIAIVSHNTKKLLLECLGSLSSSLDKTRSEVFVVDNASTDGSSEAVVEAYPWVKLINNPENIGFTRATNQALESAQGRYVALLNSDTQVDVDTFKALVGFLDSHPEAGAAGPRLVYTDGTPQPSIDAFPSLVSEFSHLYQIKKLIPGTDSRRRMASILKKVPSEAVAAYFRVYSDETTPSEVDALSGACLVVRRDVIDKTGLLDESFFMYMEDLDWCTRIRRAGFKVYYVPEVGVIHHVGQSGQADAEKKIETTYEFYRSRLYFFRKYRGWISVVLHRFIMATAFCWRWLWAATLGMVFTRQREEVITRRKLYGRITALAIRGG